jgi:hypothetical protein
MNFAHSSILVLMAAIPVCRGAEMPDCFTEEVEAHVIAQFRIHGPLSRDREYFGFVYRYEGKIESATARGTPCHSGQPCEVKTARAAAKIPKGAKVLGEWHTHPREFAADTLSLADVRGANDNRHIRCYRAFFSTSKGHIFTWDANATAVRAAMESMALLGDYRKPDVSSAVELRDHDANVIAGR